MKPNPFSGLLHSRKFWLLVLDVVASTVVYFVVKLGDTALAEDVKWLIASWQPIFAMVIGAVAYEDKAKLEAESSRLSDENWRLERAEERAEKAAEKPVQ